MEHGIAEQRRVNQGLLRVREKTGLPLVATNDAHYLHRDDHQAHDVLLCIGSGKKVADADRLALRHERVLPEERRGDGGALPGPPRGARAHRADRGDVRLHARRPVSTLPAFDVPPGFTIESYFEKVTRDGFAERRRALDPLAAAGRLRHPLADYEARLEQGDRRHPPRRLLRLLPDRLGLHPLRAASSGSRSARAAAPPRAASSPMRCASPTSTRSSTT